MFPIDQQKRIDLIRFIYNSGKRISKDCCTTDRLFFLRRDTAGQERYRSLTTSFFRDAMGFLLVFDLTKESSFINVRHWIEEIQSNAYSENVDLILVGNKSDLEAERVISKVQALELAEQNHIRYIETSALENRNVEDSVKLLLETVMNNLETNDYFPQPNHHIPRPTNDIPMDLTENPPPKKPNGTLCCNY